MNSKIYIVHKATNKAQMVFDAMDFYQNRDEYFPNGIEEGYVFQSLEPSGNPIKPCKGADDRYDRNKDAKHIMNFDQKS